MAKLIYISNVSLDGYIEDEHGKFDWATPDDEVHAFINELERPVGTYLYGRRMYEVMRAWEKMDTTNLPDFMRDYAEIWQAADKVVYSKTLREASSERTRQWLNIIVSLPSSTARLTFSMSDSVQSCPTARSPSNSSHEITPMR